MKWIDFKEEQPKEGGKYLVKTKTLMGNTNRLEILCTITEGKVSFNVSNQIVTHWLKENN